MLVAHADTYWDEHYGYSHNIRHEVIFDAGIVKSANTNYGLVADDRAGCALLWLLKGLGHSKDEYLVLQEWQNTLNLYRRWFSTDELPRFSLDKEFT